MSYIFSFIHCSSTQIMCQVCFEIYRTVMPNCSKYTIILLQASKKRMLIPTLVLHTGDREGSLWILGECGSQGSLGVAFLWKIVQCCYEICRHLFNVPKSCSVGMAQIQRGLCAHFKSANYLAIKSII